jgi:hypothetical protein
MDRSRRAITKPAWIVTGLVLTRLARSMPVGLRPAWALLRLRRLAPARSVEALYADADERRAGLVLAA